MMKTILILVATTVAAGSLALYIARRIQSRQMRRKIASEGFETATDILYPNKRRFFKKHKMGPIVQQ